MGEISRQLMGEGIEGLCVPMTVEEMTGPFLANRELARFWAALTAAQQQAVKDHYAESDRRYGVCYDGLSGKAMGWQWRFPLHIQRYEGAADLALKCVFECSKEMGLDVPDDPIPGREVWGWKKEDLPDAVEHVRRALRGG